MSSLAKPADEIRVGPSQLRVKSIASILSAQRRAYLGRQRAKVATRKNLIRHITTAERAFLKVVLPAGASTSWSPNRTSRRSLWPGCRIQFQFKVGSCYPDFVFRRQRLIVEIDGKYHRQPEQAARDKKRDAFFIRCGYTVLRIPAWFVYNDPELVFRVTQSALKGKFTEQPHWKSVIPV